MTHTDERNFRSHYYEKVGFKGVEEKKSLEILLKEDPLDVDKLTTFCQRFPVPAIHRPFVWKVVLGVLPVHQTIHKFVMKQRCEQYEDLSHALGVMRQTNNATELPETHRLMFQLEEGKLPLEESKGFSHGDFESLEAIARSMIEVVDCDRDAYWLSIMFYRLLQKQQDVISKLNERFEFYLKKEDEKLYNYLSDHQLINRLPYDLWFQQCFAAIFPVPGLERLWDRIIGGACAILIFTAVAIVVTLQRPLLNMKTPENVIKFLQKIPQDNADLIINKAIELWEKHGGYLKPDV
ncbi:TBC1 domain family member 7-like [Glandiceps talaboti]